MSSYSCCIGQKPPSPDGLPSRAVKHLSNVVHTATWSTASRLSKLEDFAELRTLFEGDNSDFEEDSSRRITLKRSTSTLDAVKLKLRKHLSRDSAISKHRPRSAVGNSDEEIQRRKELRSIRDRRIKEELSSEGVYDDDAKSVSMAAIENTPRKLGHTIINEDLDSLEFLESTLPTVLTRKSNDVYYIRNTSEFPAMQRRHSIAVLENSKFTMPATDWYQNSSDLTMPPAPELKPQILPSIVDSATRRTSWRLSFASDHRATHLRALSHEYELSSSAAGLLPHDNAPSPLKWFRGQVASALPSINGSIPARFNVPKALPLQAVYSSEVEDCQGVDGNTELQTVPILLHEMQISRRLASRGLQGYSSSPQLSSWGSQSHCRSRSYNSQFSHHEATNQDMYRSNASNVAILDSKLSTCWGDLLRDRISSIYDCASSVSNGPNFNIPSSLVADSEEVSFPSFDSHVVSVFQGPPAIAITLNAAESKPPMDSKLLTSHGVRSATCKSILTSETLSFLEREAELAMIQTRFPKVMAKSTHTPSVRSKFNEEFGENHQMPAPVTPRGKMSLSMFLKIPKLAKLVSRTYDGASSFELQDPGRQGFGFAFSNKSNTIAGTVSPRARSSATNSPVKHLPQAQSELAAKIRAQALIRTQEEHNLQRASTSPITKKDLSYHHVRFLTGRSASWSLKGKERASVDLLESGKTAKLPMASRDFKLERELRREARKIETESAKVGEWADKPEAQVRRPLVTTAAVVKYSSPWRPKMPSESWTRFPSHDRGDRTASAGLSDHVSPKDFAIKNIEDGVVEWMKGDRKHHHHHHEKEQHHSMPVKLSKQIRLSLYKLRTLMSTATADAIHGRKGSVSVGGNLEFPELEILAGEIPSGGLFEEAENETEESMRNSERVARMVVFGEDGMIGEVDVKGNMTIVENCETSEISIADPRFYDDCVTLPLEDDEDDEMRSKSSITTTPVGKLDSCKMDKATIKTEKSHTWSGRDRGGKVPLDSMALRGSTLDFQVELEQMEKLERDRAIRSADEAWGESVTPGNY